MACLGEFAGDELPMSRAQFVALRWGQLCPGIVCGAGGGVTGAVYWRQVEAVNAEYLFICPNCKKVIGIGVRKAAWIN